MGEEEGKNTDGEERGEKGGARIKKKEKMQVSVASVNKRLGVNQQIKKHV